MNNSTSDFIYIMGSPLFLIALAALAIWAARRSRDNYQMLHGRNRILKNSVTDSIQGSRGPTNAPPRRVERLDYFKIFLVGVPFSFIVWVIFFFLVGPIYSLYFTFISMVVYTFTCVFFSKELNLRIYEPNNLRQKVMYVMITIIVIAQLTAYYIGYVYSEREYSYFAKGAVAPLVLIAALIDWFLKRSSNKKIKSNEK